VAKEKKKVERRKKLENKAELKTAEEVSSTDFISVAIHTRARFHISSKICRMRRRARLTSALCA